MASSSKDLRARPAPLAAELVDDDIPFAAYIAELRDRGELAKLADPEWTPEHEREPVPFEYLVNGLAQAFRALAEQGAAEHARDVTPGASVPSGVPALEDRRRMTRSALLALLLLAGCFPANVTTTRISREADGSIVVDSGKDVAIGRLVYDAPDGTRLEVRDYTSSPNAAAIDAQRERERAQLEGALHAVERGVELGVGAAARGAVP